MLETFVHSVSVEGVIVGILVFYDGVFEMFACRKFLKSYRNFRPAIPVWPMSHPTFTVNARVLCYHGPRNEAKV